MKQTVITYSLRAIVLCAFLFCSAQKGFAQNSNSGVVQLSGLVMNADSTETVFGVHIFALKTGRGTVSDYRGWFSKAFYAGDTLIFTSIGFKDRKIVVPDSVGDQYTIIVAMEEEVTQLPDVEVSRFPSEELFKEAFLAMNLNEEQESVLNAFAPEAVQRMVLTMPMGGSPDANYRYMMNQQYNQMQYRSGPTTNPLLNPFAWAKFINSLKKKK
ncbi:carboxypeptidase-like protein [Roseivirga ehrenbergii]|uniref:carboxypeptidase-like regulatory domain-containing protein n=1 Tax=Roseivirga ehrenbergii (strain DSM 102268 / JCM 13514 / KCTC 12282 / NCIMB 14502 / KMM 6017) TaxID=279360 RepID=UPI000A4608CA|nr:carboxypeptidase-like regulatory domain-containing protein [Roseivirga ehrenbergii]TCK99108.1 carboxypeptidase-like protein [Roseivirga ehrenbergii]